MAKIRLKFNQAIIKEYALSKDTLSFGRKEGNDIVIPHPAVSGFHGKILKEGDDVFVEDLNSTNGTFVNGRKIKRSKIGDKDNIRVAKHILEYIGTDEPVAAAPPPPEMAGTPIEKGPAEPAAPSAPASTVDQQKEVLRQTLSNPAPAQPAPPSPAPQPVAPASTAETATPAPPPPAGEKIPKIKVVSGAEDGAPKEWELKELNTYIGTSAKAQIKIKGFLAPDLAATISKRPDGFYLKAIKAGYPKVDGKAIKDQVLLESGATIECGSLSMLFIMVTKK